MFYRGQKVVISESNVDGRKHPAVGDEGYVSNVFLFPVERFVLMNLFMSSYKKGGSRCEQKKLIIDVGMSDETRKTLEKGVNKLYFVTKRYINLTPSFLYKGNAKLSNGLSYIQVFGFPQLIGTYGIWSRYVSNTTKRDRYHDKETIIPIGHIVPCKRMGHRSHLEIIELHAWIKAITPNLVATCQLYNDYYNTEGSKLL